MLITFKSKAAAEVLMYEEHAQRILDLLNKDITRGVITAAETGNAVAKIETEIAAHKISAATAATQHDIDTQLAHDNNEPAPPAPVSFSTRAYPLLEMLRAAHKNQCDVMWGV